MIGARGALLVGARGALLVGAAVALAGCGLGPGPGTGSVQITVTRGFGSTILRSVSRARVPGSETVMRMTERSFSVQKRYGGGFIETIDGQSGDASRHDWFYYVNGVQGSIGAASTAVHRGDRIWWDLHDWRATITVPAVVGSFPEPFVHGVGGKRLPTTLECATGVNAACSRVATVLRAAGVPVAQQLIGTGSGPDTLGVVVGTWRELGAQVVSSLIEHGPSASGVYARFAGAGGRSLQLLDPGGRVVRTLGPGAGLVAATADSKSEPTWLVTGTDLAGVRAAADALTPERLRDRFALAVQGGADLALPLQGTR